MNKEEIFKIIQDYISDPPLMLIGTGLTIPAGIPGMKELGKYLQKNLDDKYSKDRNWEDVSNKLNNGEDLETALTGYTLNEALLNDIKSLTWELISNSDLRIFKEDFLFGVNPPFSKLLRKLLQPSRHHLDIITTNYDRYIEYCCDICNVAVSNGFSGTYLKKLKEINLNSKNNITLLKVHGSLDSFFDIKNRIGISLPLQETIPNGFVPEIITPGTNKFEEIMTSTSRQMVHYADSLIDRARTFLCIGYGFNDTQIQERIIARIRSGIPIVIVTKDLTDRALGIINNSSSNYAVILDGGKNKTRFIINKKETIIDGLYWTIEGFDKII